MVLVRLCKTALVASVALFFTLVAVGNVTDYDSNWQFVRHVLSMDTVFPDSALKWRAITDVRAQTAGYLAIIATQVAVALILWVAAARMLASLRRRAFADARATAALGLTLALLLYSVGFIAIAGEWFAMWQSSTWNGHAKAFQFVGWISAVLLVVLMPEQEAG